MISAAMASAGQLCDPGLISKPVGDLALDAETSVDILSIDIVNIRKATDGGGE